MTQANIKQVSPGLLELSGVLDYSSGPALREQGGRLLKASQAAALVLDCSAVVKSSSVGLALLLAFIRDAQALNKSLSLRGLPSDMREIAGVSGLADILPLAS